MTASSRLAVVVAFLLVSVYADADVDDELRDEVDEELDHERHHHHPLSNRTMSFMVKEGDERVVECPGGEFTKLVFAGYGRQTYSNATGKFAIDPKYNCNSESSRWVVAQLCRQRSRCALHATNKHFGDPCQGVPKTLAVSLVCTSAVPTPTQASVMRQQQSRSIAKQSPGTGEAPANATQGPASNGPSGSTTTMTTPPSTRMFTLKENEQQTVSCGTGVFKEVVWAGYGRQVSDSQKMTAAVDPAYNCTAALSADVVKTACVGKPSCTLTASNAVFGDPCVGVVKTLTAVMTCA